MRDVSSLAARAGENSAKRIVPMIMITMCEWVIHKTHQAAIFSVGGMSGIIMWILIMFPWEPRLFLIRERDDDEVKGFKQPHNSEVNKLELRLQQNAIPIKLQETYRVSQKSVKF